jgi:hypothetical protein
LWAEEDEQIELLVGERHRRAIDAHLPAAGVHLDPVAHDDHRRLGSRRPRRGGAVPAQDGLDASDDLAWRERLDDVVVGPELQADHAIDLTVACGQEENRHEALQPDTPADLEAVDARQPDVEDHQSRPVLCHQLQAALS